MDLVLGYRYSSDAKFETGYSGWLLPLTAYAGLVLPFFLPAIVSNMIKPFGIMIALYHIMRSKRIVFKASHFFLLIYALLVFIAMVRSQNSSSYASSIGSILYVGYAFCYLSVEHTRKSIERLISCCFYAGTAFALIATISNPLWGTGAMERTYLRMFSRVMNSNQIAYISAIGLSTLPYILLDEHGLKKHWMKYLPAIMLMFYVLLLTMSRGAFISSIAAVAVLFYDLIRRYSKRSFIYTFVLLSVCAVGISLVFKYMPEDQFSRLMSKDSYEDASGRFDMFEEAISMVNNPVFGEGAGVWQARGHSLKIHNFFIDIFVETGILGVSVFALPLIMLFASVRRMDVLCIAAPMVISAMVESGDDYIFWVPYILSMLLVQYDWLITRRNR